MIKDLLIKLIEFRYSKQEVSDHVSNPHNKYRTSEDWYLKYEINNKLTPLFKAV